MTEPLPPVGGRARERATGRGALVPSTDHDLRAGEHGQLRLPGRGRGDPSTTQEVMMPAQKRKRRAIGDNPLDVLVSRGEVGKPAKAEASAPAAKVRAVGEEIEPAGFPMTWDTYRLR